MNRRWMRTLLRCGIVLGGVLFVAAIIMPALARRGGGIYSGSYEYARQWATELAACDSLEDVKQRFNCIRLESPAEGMYEVVKVSDVGKKRPSALVQALADGNWIACAYANSHGNKAGGTLVARDSEGTIRAFFGHICGRPAPLRGETLDGVYAELAEYLTEVSLDREEPTEARSQAPGDSLKCPWEAGATNPGRSSMIAPQASVDAPIFRATDSNN